MGSLQSVEGALTQYNAHIRIEGTPKEAKMRDRWDESRKNALETMHALPSVKGGGRVAQKSNEALANQLPQKRRLEELCEMRNVKRANLFFSLFDV